MSVSPDFFKTLEIPVLLGRGFTEHDVATPDAVAMINETAANKFFAGENAIGQRIGSSTEEAGKTEIIGVIKDTKYQQPARRLRRHAVPRPADEHATRSA